jgi:hypothetical protein
MDEFSQLKERFLAMPSMLRLLVSASLVFGIVLPLLPLFPGASFGLNGRELTYQELWYTGVAFALFALGPIMLIVGIAVLLRKSWIRPFLVGLPILQVLPFLVVHWVLDAPNPVPSLSVFASSCIVWAAVAVAYLFGARGAREHFGSAV